MKKILLLLLFIVPICVYSQDQIEEKPGTYIGEGKIWWNKSLGVYITLTSANGDTVNLEKPFYLDTEGPNYLRTKWEMDSTGKYVHPFGEQTWEFFADGLPPKTTLKLIAEQSYIFRGKTYYSDDLKAKLTSTDEGSGIQKIYYSINGGDYQVYDSLISFDPGLDINLQFYAVDNVGNVESIGKLSYDYDNNNLSFGVDDVAPITAIEEIDSILAPSDEIVLTSQDGEGVGVNSIYYSFDDDPLIQYTNPIQLENMKDGKYVLSYFAVDWINNKELVRTTNFYLDAIPPEIQVTEKIVDGKLSGLRKIQIEATDNKSGVDKVYVLLENSAEYVEYKNPIYLNVSDTRLTIKAIDLKGNERIRVIQYSNQK